VYISNQAAASNNKEKKQWIALTRKLLAHEDADALQTARNRLLYEVMDEIMENLPHELRSRWTDDMQYGLGKVIASSMELAQLLHGQTARFQVKMVPAVSSDGKPASFDPNEMEDIGVEDEEDPRDRCVGVSVFPSICKWGDERGENVRPLSAACVRVSCSRFRIGRCHAGGFEGQGFDSEEGQDAAGYQPRASQGGPDCDRRKCEGGVGQTGEYEEAGFRGGGIQGVLLQ